MIQQQMELDCPFRALELSPVEQRRAQIDHRGIQAHQGVLEAKRLATPTDGQGPAADPAADGKPARTAARDGVRWHRQEVERLGYPDSEITQFAFATGQTAADFPQAVRPTQLGNTKEIETIVAKAVEHNLLLRDNRRLVEELRRTNAELEERVKERTRQLEQRALELEEANRKISDLVYLDPLTGVANRRSLDATLAREVERVSRLGLSLTVIMVDVDHFKVVNDTLSHAMGDKVLQALASTMAGLLRPYDLVARYGGEEFLIMMPGTSLKNGVLAAERLRAAVSRIAIEGLTQQITASFGVATLLPKQPSDSLVGRADKAMYLAKQKGRNRVETAGEAEEGAGQ